MNMLNFQNSTKQNQFNKFSRQLNTMIKNGAFDHYTVQKRSMLISRLKRLYNQLLDSIPEFKLKKILGAAVCALLLSLSTHQAKAQGPFINNIDQNPLKPPAVSVCANARPAFIDIDNDGDLDLFLSNEGGGIAYYKNTGNNINPVFERQTGLNNPLDSINGGRYISPVFVDIDNDGDFDAFIGASSLIKYYKNTGNAITPAFTEQTGINNPFTGIGLYTGDYSSPVFVDIDNDGDFDVFIGQWSPGIINYCENTGNSITPVFTVQTGTNNPFDSVDVGFGSAPAFVDIDNDGDFDGFIGARDGFINYYENTGNNVTPVFTAQTGTNNPFDSVDVGKRSAPTFVDIDNDGDQDAMIGNEYGEINYYKNTGTINNPLFTEQSGSSDPFGGGVKVNSLSSPAFTDIDNDGDLDVFIGEYSGVINYFKNTGNNTNPFFTKQTGLNNPFDTINVGYFVRPSFIDIDNDGDFDAFMGSGGDTIIRYYKNTGNNVNPIFSKQTGANNPFDGTNVGTYASQAFVDIDNDGDFDAFIGVEDGTIKYLKNIGNNVTPVFAEQVGANNPFNGVDVGDFGTLTFGDIDNDGDFDVLIGEYYYGTIKYYENTGDNVNPVFAELTGANNPFIGVSVGYYSTPVLADIDNDGDLDVFIGETCGTVLFYENLDDPQQCTASITTTNATCGNSDGTATVSVTEGIPPYSYTWSNGDTLPTATGLPAGINYVTVEDATGCIAYGTATVSDDGAPNIAVDSTNVTCSGFANGAINLTVTGGTPSYTYTWSHGSVAEDLSNLIAGNYEITVEDAAGCISSKSITITEPVAMDISLSITDATCLGSDGTASTDVTGGTQPWSYIWFSGQTTDSIGGLPAGVYWVSVTDTNACTKTEPVIINNAGGPVISILSVTNPTCADSTAGAIDIDVSGGTPGYSYLWSNSATSQDISGITPGTYSVTVTDTANCDGSKSIDLITEPPASPSICVVTVDSASVENLIVWEKTGAGIGSYNIYKEGSAAGVYFLAGTVPYDSVSTFTDTLADPRQRSWRYKIAAVDSCGNESELSQLHKTMHLTMNQGINGEVNLIWDHYEGFSFGTYIIYRATPTTGLDSIAALPGNLHSYSDWSHPGGELYYQVAAVHSTGCYPTQNKTLVYNSAKSNVTNRLTIPLGISNPSRQDGTGFNVYPNPNTGNFTLEIYTSETRNYQINIINILGQLVYTETLNNIKGNYKKQLNLKANPAGIYNLQLISGKEIINIKIILE